MSYLQQGPSLGPVLQITICLWEDKLIRDDLALAGIIFKFEHCLNIYKSIVWPLHNVHCAYQPYHSWPKYKSSKMGNWIFQGEMNIIKYVNSYINKLREKNVHSPKFNGPVSD